MNIMGAYNSWMPSGPIWKKTGKNVKKLSWKSLLKIQLQIEITKFFWINSLERMFAIGVNKRDFLENQTL